jgi:mono/diheme cytochrome c family protein
MLRRLLIGVLVAALIAAAAGWLLTAPQPLAASELPAHQPDPANGELIFHAAGCASCHAAPKAKGEERLKLGGGLELATPFGLFRVPNISPDPTGIGGWSTLDFVNAVMRGLAPNGAHLYPAFPYGSYAKMRVEDVIDLKAFLDTLPPVANRVAGHDLPFPFTIRRGIGMWKRLYLSPEPVIALAGADDELRRGQYLVEGPGHCGECHTSRDFIGGLKTGLWLAGAPNPEGRGSIPNITPHAEGIGAWSAAEIADLLKTGFTPDFDTLGGRMREVQESLSHMPDTDLAAIAAYLKAVPPLPDAVPRQPAGEPQPGG